MKTFTDGRANRPAEEPAGDAGASPEPGESEAEDDDRPPGAGKGAGQKRKEARNESGIIRQECRRPARGWS